MEYFVNLVGSMGFPIACCMVLAYYVKHITDENKKEVKELNELHSDEMMNFKDKLMETIDNNTKAIMELSEKINNLEVKKE